MLAIGTETRQKTHRPTRLSRQLESLTDHTLCILRVAHMLKHRNNFLLNRRHHYSLSQCQSQPILCLLYLFFCTKFVILAWTLLDIFHSTSVLLNIPPTIHSTSVLLYTPPTIYSIFLFLFTPPTIHSTSVFLYTPPTIYSTFLFLFTPSTTHSTSVLLFTPPTIHSNFALLYTPTILYSTLVLLYAPPTIHSNFMLRYTPPTIHSTIVLIHTPPTIHSTFVLFYMPPSIHNTSVALYIPPIIYSTSVVLYIPPTMHYTNDTYMFLNTTLTIHSTSLILSHNSHSSIFRPQFTVLLWFSVFLLQFTFLPWSCIYLHNSHYLCVRWYLSQLLAQPPAITAIINLLIPSFFLWITYLTYLCTKILMRYYFRGLYLLGGWMLSHMVMECHWSDTDGCSFMTFLSALFSEKIMGKPTILIKNCDVLTVGGIKNDVLLEMSRSNIS